LPRADRDERRLLAGVRAGSRSDLEQLFRAHWWRAHRAALLIVRDAAAAEDIAQESFVAALRAIDRFDRRRPFGPWLHRIVVNRSIDWTRTRTLRRESPLPAGHLDSEWEPPQLELSDEVADALGRLDLDRRAAIVMRYLLDYTPGEIAELLEVPRGTVNSRLRRGLDELAGELER
jgi:RNA polymerase sigma-70 factor (ECF subfamily)